MYMWMTVAVIRSAGSDVTSIGGGGTVLVWRLCKNASSHTWREHMKVPNMHQAVSFKYFCYNSLFSCIYATPQLSPEITHPHSCDYQISLSLSRVANHYFLNQVQTFYTGRCATVSSLAPVAVCVNILYGVELNTLWNHICLMKGGQ